MASSGWNGQASVAYSYDANGNLLEEDGRLAVTTYKYNGQNRMVYSRVVDKLKKTVTATRYEYDSFGRRVITQEEDRDTMKTLYDGFTFEIVKESPILVNGMFTDKYNTGIQYSSSDNGKQASGRYRYVDDSRQDGRYSNIDDDLYANTAARNTRSRAILYGNGSPVAVNRGNDTAYLGTDILGSVRSTTADNAEVENSYDYDVFGTPITGNYGSGADFGYLGKPYDTATGLYNYGYRDYSPTTARFTTVDPIRDGANWFVYVNGDPVNWVDLWGLTNIKANDVNENPISERNKKVSATVTIERPTDGYGNSFDSKRTTIVTYQNGQKETYVDMVAANAKSAEWAEDKKGMTLPDGNYTVTTEWLHVKEDGSYNSGSYKNVLRLQTSDENIPKETRDSINNDMYLFHPDQRIIDQTSYWKGIDPRSAGCPIVSGQEGQDKFMSYLNGVPVEKISTTITSAEKIKNK